MSYTEIEDNAISDGSVVTEPSSDLQNHTEEPPYSAPYYQQYQADAVPYGDTPLPDYEYQTKRNTVYEFYELGFFSKIFGFAAFAFLCIGLIIWLSGISALGATVNWVQLFATVCPMCMGIFIITGKIANAYNAILVLLLFSISTGIFAFFDMVCLASAVNPSSKTAAAAAGEFFVFFGHALMATSCTLSFFGK